MSTAEKAPHVTALEESITQIEQSQKDRDDAIRAAYKAGMSAIEIAAAVGLTRSRIHQIVNT